MSGIESEAVRRYRAALGEAAHQGWLSALRRQAFEAYAACGFPSRRLEEWRYTDVAPIADESWIVSQDAAADVDLALPDFEGHRLVFVDGRYAPSASRSLDDRAIDFSSLADAASRERGGILARYGSLANGKDRGFTAFNTAFARDAAVVTLKRDAGTASPLHLVFVSSAGAPAHASFPRLLLVAEPGSHAQVLIDHVSSGTESHFSCAVSEIELEEGASLDLFLVQRENDASYHVARQCVRQQRDSRFSIHTVSLGGAIVRNDLEIVLADEGATCTLAGLALGRDRQVLDNHTCVDHAMPHCESHELYKGIVAGASRGVFRGRVIVRPDAQQSIATQQNQNLVLGTNAEVDTKPQLEIHADDVRCSHGSSIGQLDPEALFFLRARGLDESTARALLTKGFASQITQSIPHEGVREWLSARVAERLETVFSRGGAA